jgi:starch-binding outer membrane protein, SusD/RagB family
MKNIINGQKRVLLLVSLLAVWGCEDSILNTAPSNSINSENFFETTDDAVAALNGAYQPLQWPNLYNLRIWALDMVAGNAEVGAGGGDDGLETKQLAEFIVQPDNPGVEDMWRGIWPGVANSNFVIYHVRRMSNIDSGLKDRIVAEAKFLRALYYFNGVRLYGGLPIILDPSSEELMVTRASVSATYDRIIADLLDAEAVLPEYYSNERYHEVGRATKGAARGLLAKVYLTLSDYEKAEEYARKVIEMGIYELHHDFTRNFDPDHNNGVESLFEVQYSSGSAFNQFEKRHQGSWLPEFTNPRGSRLSPWGGFGWGHVTQEFVDTFEEGDRRKSQTIWQDGDTWDGFTYRSFFSSTGYNIKKWVRGSSSVTGMDSNLNFPVLRYADVLLTLAEAINEQGRPGEAAPFVNEVRFRANLSGVSGLTQEQMRERILHERRVEFAFEGHWWFDLMRAGPEFAEAFFHGIGKENFDKHKHILFPIPRTEMDLNRNMEQNPGY